MSDFRILELVDIFSDLTPRQLKKIFAICKERSAVRGDFIVEQNTPSSEIYFIISGEIEILVNSEDDAQPKRIALLRTGQLFGEIALVDQGLRSASARCLSESCRLLEIARDDFLGLLRSDQKMGFQVLYNLAADLCLKIRRTTFLVREDLLYSPRKEG